MAVVNAGGISQSNISIIWGPGWMTLWAKHAKLTILGIHAKKLIYHFINQAKMVILCVNFWVWLPSSCTWPRNPNWPWIQAWTWYPVGSRPGKLFYAWEGLFYFRSWFINSSWPVLIFFYPSGAKETVNTFCPANNPERSNENPIWWRWHGDMVHKASLFYYVVMSKLCLRHS